MNDNSDGFFEPAISRRRLDVYFSSYGVELCWSSSCLGREGSWLWQGCLDGRRSRQQDSFSVDAVWPSSVLFTGRTLSPPVGNWEAIHACGKRCPLGECVSVLWGHPFCPGIRWLSVRAVKTVALTPLAAEGLPFSHQRVDSSFSSLWPKAFEHSWGRLLLFIRGHILKDEKFPKTELYSRDSSVSAPFVIYWIVKPPLSLVSWIEACLHSIKSDIQTIIFSLKKIMKIIYLKLLKLNGSLILLKIPSSTFKPVEGKI